jgi:anti-sigma B factor antagonist
MASNNDPNGHAVWRLTIGNEHHNGVLVVAPAGRIAAASVGLLERAFAEALAQGTHQLVLDLEGVDYISSAGLQAIDAFVARLHATNAMLVVCGVADAVRLTFDLAGLLPRMTVEPSRERAIARVTSPRPSA